MWSCRDSNPGPNTVHITILRAYPACLEPANRPYKRLVNPLNRPMVVTVFPEGPDG